MEELDGQRADPGWRDHLAAFWQRRGYPFTKRCIDLFGAATLLLLLAPLCLLVACWIRLDSTGPAIFRQRRVGRNGRTFTAYKFRSMTVQAEEAVHQNYVIGLLRSGSVGQVTLYKVPNDLRITRAGALLRRSSIDELPQLLNVLRGEMSLVGPRPSIPYEVAEYEPWMRRRLDVLPGITGLWQVSGRSRLSVQQMLQLDVEYAERQSLGLDLLILARTIPAVLLPGRAA